MSVVIHSKDDELNARGECSNIPHSSPTHQTAEQRGTKRQQRSN
jgi:hypothetical protein